MESIVLQESPVFSEDYIHSSNSLFHFMKRPEYLFKAISDNALIPRYCEEDIEYLTLSSEGKPFKKMAVLMKCFCDIPLHKITQKFDTVNNHTSLYGEYAIAFSKAWGEAKGIQPITYLNTASQYLIELSTTINGAISDETDVSDLVANNYLLQLAFFKPLRGSMVREKCIIEKNFHDEQEWRHVPSIAFHDEEFEPVIANPLLLENESKLSLNPIALLSNKLCEKIYHEYWLKFSFDDLRYIIVPNKQSRLELIEYVLAMPEDAFTTKNEKYILISKILVLEEIRKDW